MENVIEKVKVGIADFNIVHGSQVISTSGLGSCIGLILFDEGRKLAGLVHIMLPDSSLSRTDEFKLGKFADTGIEALIKLLEDNGSLKRRLTAKMAGGAQMFNISSNNEKMKIGHKNAIAVEKILETEGIPLIAKDVGGNKGRSIEFDSESCQLKIRTVYEGTTYI
ncbi:chemotaxis protein CheD [Filobacillus milosensis]|uniref:Probable chemoreceptor glutamine deamidase CheD n=1 Tax=Filobacillus milosensis TaxID=94137 RepID=A0A4Y8INY4_9BACI|nr:chemotaxis protein CheD [Filobacillus milosensis]TFB23189.1 chemotaxis protein CheD [Filobacillus milosensis]